MGLEQPAVSASRSHRSAKRAVVAGLSLLLVVACFDESSSVEDSGASETQGSGASTSTAGPGEATANASADTSELDGTTTSPDPNTGTSADTTGSMTTTAAESGGSSDSSGGRAVWLCGGQPDVYACESFERGDDVGAAWTVEPTDQVTATLDSDDQSGNHLHYRLDGEDGLRAQTSISFDVDGVTSVHVELALRFHNAVDGCSTGTGGDLTVLSMVRVASTGGDEQLILQVGPTSATLYSTGATTDDVVTLLPTETLEQWFQVALDLNLNDGSAGLDVGGVTGAGVQNNWSLPDVQNTLDLSFGPASDNDGDTFTDCEFDIDNVVVAIE